MALTDSQKSNVRGYLGYPDTYADSFYAVNSILDSLSPETEAAVVALIAKIQAVETAIDTDAIDTAGISSVGQGDPEFYEGRIIKDRRALGRGLCRKLSIKTGIEIRADYFGEGASNGVGFTTFFCG